MYYFYGPHAYAGVCVRLTATATATDLKRKRAQLQRTKPDDVASCDSWSWVVSIPKAQSFSHVQVVPPVALYSIYIFIPMHI